RVRDLSRDLAVSGLENEGGVDVAVRSFRADGPLADKRGRILRRRGAGFRFVLCGRRQSGGNPKRRGNADGEQRVHVRTLWGNTRVQISPYPISSASAPRREIEEASRRLGLAEALGIQSVPNRTLWQAALVRAHQSRVVVYDTLFVELAVRERVPFVSFDAEL